MRFLLFIAFSPPALAMRVLCSCWRSVPLGTSCGAASRRGFSRSPPIHFLPPASVRAVLLSVLSYELIIADMLRAVNDFLILHLLYIYRYSVIYPPYIYNSMPSTYGAHFNRFCIPIFYVNSLYGVFRRSAWIYTLKRKNASQRKFDGLVTNNIFVIIVTLIITFSIWIVKNCHQALYRYSLLRTSPDTAPSTCQLANTYQAVKVLTNPRLPQAHASTRAHNTRAGKDSHSIMNVIIIVFIIRQFIYLFVFFVGH